MRTDPTVYLVVWPDELIIKAGYSERERWRAFIARNAQVRALLSFDTSTPAFELEWELHIELSAGLPLAFAGRDQARPYLGGHGDGWRETYSAPDAERFEFGLNLCMDAMRRRIAEPHELMDFGGALPTLMHGRNERTEKDGDITSVRYRAAVSVRARENRISSKVDR